MTEWTESTMSEEDHRVGHRSCVTLVPVDLVLDGSRGRLGRWRVVAGMSGDDDSFDEQDEQEPDRGKKEGERIVQVWQSRVELGEAAAQEVDDAGPAEHPSGEGVAQGEDAFARAAPPEDPWQEGPEEADRCDCGSEGDLQPY